MSESLERTVAVIAAAMALTTGATIGIAEEATLPPGTDVAVASEKSLPIDIEIGADAVSKYVWRGQLLTDDPVLQPTATVSWKGLSLNIWGSLDLTDIHEGSGDSYHLQELDYTLAYAISPVEGLDLQVGVIQYTFPGTTYPGTAEVFGSVALSKVPLTPTLAVYGDFDEADSLYANLGLGHTFELTEKLGLSLGTSLGWGNAHYHKYYFSKDRNVFSDLLLSSSLDYSVNEYLSLSLYLKFSEMVDGGMRRAARAAYGDSEVVFGGVNATFAF